MDPEHPIYLDNKPTNQHEKHRNYLVQRGFQIENYHINPKRSSKFR